MEPSRHFNHNTVSGIANSSRAVAMVYSRLAAQELELDSPSTQGRDSYDVNSAIQKLRMYWHWVLHVLALFLLLSLLFFRPLAFPNGCGEEFAHQGEGQSADATSSTHRPRKPSVHG